MRNQHIFSIFIYRLKIDYMLINKSFFASITSVCSVCNYDYLLCSSSTSKFTPRFDSIWSAADRSATAVIVSIAVTIANVTAVGINISQIIRFAYPIRANTDGIMPTSTDNPAIVDPPAITT
jgi:hypothetical protein